MSRTTSGYLALILGLSLSLGGLAIAGPAGASTKWKVVASGSIKANLVTDANAEIMNPAKIEVSVTGPGLVQWAMICVKGSKQIKTSGKETFTSSGTEQLKVAKSASECEVAANALNEGSGKLTLSIKTAG